MSMLLVFRCFPLASPPPHRIARHAPSSVVESASRGDQGGAEAFADRVREKRVSCGTAVVNNTNKNINFVHTRMMFVGVTPLRPTAVRTRSVPLSITRRYYARSDCGTNFIAKATHTYAYTLTHTPLLYAAVRVYIIYIYTSTEQSAWIPEKFKFI